IRLGLGTHQLGTGSVVSAEGTIAAYRDHDNLETSIAFTLSYDGQNVVVNVAAGTFASPAALAAHVQAAIDQAFTGAGLGDVGVVVSLDAGEVVRIALPAAVHTLGTTST